MPIFERDPWRFQFFSSVACPDSVRIPTDDLDCWPWFPKHRWIYNRLNIAESQGLACAPHGILPAHFPVFSKPIVNLRGMGIGSCKISTREEMLHRSQPGHMWMELLTGEHLSTDCAVENGKLAWLRHATGKTLQGGTFDYWTIMSDVDPQIEGFLRQWIVQNLPDYSGMLNVETIGGKIIEAHLRFADQWCDLYGRGWVEALIGLYADGKWNFADEQRIDSYSIPLFADHGQRFNHPSAAAQERIRAMPAVTSLQITFHENLPAEIHAMPPGGFRLGIVNATNLQDGLWAREELAREFPNVKPFHHHQSNARPQKQDRMMNEASP